MTSDRDVELLAGPNDGDSGHDDVAGFTQRLKALATTAPVHDLDIRKSQVQKADFAIYQMSELALHCIDLVTIAMDFDSGAAPSRVLAGVARRAAVQGPDREDSEHRRVAQWVLENLLNVGSVDRGFRMVYGVSNSGGYDRRTFDFKLLEEAIGSDGERYLRASNEAVNVLVGALEVDLEAAHIAADVRLEILIKRGRLAEAQAAAQTARYRTIQYGETLRRFLDATSRDVRSVDWAVAMPKFIEEALSHIEGRYRAENAILVNITNVRDTAETAVRKVQAAQLVIVVRDCLRRHDQLQNALQSAGRKFRAEQDRQVFVANNASAALDLYSQLLNPVLSCVVGDAAFPLQRFFTSVTGLKIPRALRLADLFDVLITPPLERDELGGVVEMPSLTSSGEEHRFPEASYVHLDQLLDLDTQTPQRLSGLLAAARMRQMKDPEAEDLVLLVVVRVLALAAQEIGAARRNGEARVLMALDDGTLLDDPDFAGSDFLVGYTEVVKDDLISITNPQVGIPNGGQYDG